MTTIQSSGIEPGQRRLNGPQTTGRSYRNLSEAAHAMTRDDDVAVPMRDGIALLADVHRPAESGRYPVLVAASPYPRQIQDLGAPAGFIEAGASDFFVPRGYVHVIANCRGTSGSGGTFGFFDSQERRDMHDLVEWGAQQPWSDGSVGMVGISYFAGNANGGRSGAASASESHYAHRRDIRPLRVGYASWSDEQRFHHAVSLYDRHDIWSYE